MEENVKTQKSRRRRRFVGCIIAAACIIVLLITAAFFAARNFIFAGFKIIPLNSRNIDLNGAGITDADPLFRLESPETADLRGNNIPQEQILRFAEAYPECEITYDIQMGRQFFCNESGGTLDLSKSGASAPEILGKLGYFSGVDSVILPAAPFSLPEQLEIAEAYPEISFNWNVRICGVLWSDSSESLLLAGKKPDLSTLLSAAPLMDRLKKIDVSGWGLSLDDLILLSGTYKDAFVESDFTIYGLPCSTDADKMYLDGVPVQDTGELEKATAVMPNLTTVYMNGCGLTNEAMAELCKKHEDIEFVWTVYFGGYALRTDATSFCASKLPETGFVGRKLTSAQLDPIKYCTRLEALDLGHMPVTDLSFLSGMKNLKYLVLSDQDFTDITVLGTLKELYFAELFMSSVKDLSPLLDCPKLEYLNVGYSFNFDTSVLKQFTNLKMLWYPGNYLGEWEKAEIAAALPNTECFMPKRDADGSTGGGWRSSKAYYEMRDALGMFYQPAGTGIKR